MSFSPASLTRAFSRVARTPAVRPAAAARAAARSAAASLVEPLEQRAMYSVSPDPGNSFATAYNVGDLNGSVTLDDAVGGADDSDIYKFTLTRGGQFFGRLRAYAAPVEVALIQEVTDPVTGQVQELFVDARVANQNGPDGGFSSGDLPGKFLQAGTYYLIATPLAGSSPYLIRFTADYAGSSIGTARDIGSAAEDTYRDFVGDFGSPSLTDPTDFYKVKVDAPGQLQVDLALDNTNPDLFKAHVDLIRDANGNGTVDAGEVIGSSPSAVAGTVLQDVPAGTYFLRVVSDLDYSNYRLRVNADYAGSSVGTWRQTGPLDVGKSFLDYIGNPIDKLDQYKFSVSQTRPLYLAMSEQDNGTSILSVYKDTNNNGIAESTELLEATSAGSFNTLIRTVDAGNYIVRVSAVDGQGKYNLFAETRPDGAGNTLGTAKNLGAVNGLKTVEDYLSGGDTVDYYKFTMTAAGSVGASLNAYLGGNADLTLVRDANNNGVVDPGEVLAAASQPAGTPDSLTKSLAAGNYFLGVRYAGPAGGASKYALTFHTDYAGGSPATARNVGTLAGTKAFDDWASQNYGGVISDTVDLYKFNITSAKTLTAKLTGQLSGEDLTLQLFRDANGNGTLEGNELIAASGKPNTPNEQITKSLGAGTYFVRVVGTNGDTNYHLALTA